MKKISLKDNKNILSRKEMKKISGGGFGICGGISYCVSSNRCSQGCEIRELGGDDCYECSGCCIA